MRVLAGQLYSVLKLRIGVAIAVSALAGLAVTPGPAPPAWQIGVLALVIFAHTLAVVAASLVPALYGLGWIYLVLALLGGAWFIVRSAQLVRQPDRTHAMMNFRASLGQLGLLLTAAMLDPLLLG